jgi:hypothetical protein
MITQFSTTPDDTERGLQLQTRAIVNADFIHGYNALNGHLVVYRHFNDSRKLYYGTIYSVIPETFSLAIYVKPQAGQGISLVKPYHMNELRLVEGWS